MGPLFPAGILIAVVVFHATVVLSSFPATLHLERGVPASHKLKLSQLKERDRVRHSRMLQSSGGGVVDFPVQGTFDPFLVGLYYTRLQLGSPPRDFYVQIDTGSDVLWVSCSSCNGCPVSSGLHIPLNFFDPGSSPTASLISCSDQRCSLGLQSSDSVCAAQNNQCGYTFQYGDGSGTSGYYVSDLLHFDTILGGSVMNNSSAPIVFGCSTLQTGDLTKPDRAVDGIFGFGQQDMSVISQLASQGITPRVFSHCLKGDDAGGGILVLGEIVEPNIVYTPLVPSQIRWKVTSSCDTAVVVNVLGNRNASQRDSIQQEYEALFSDDLEKQLALELHGNLKKAVSLWMKSPVERDVTTLRQALTGPIIDIKAATEIIYTTRYDGPEIERVLVEEDAIAISKIEVKKSGMDESAFIQIFTERSSAHLAALASAYHKMFRKELRKTIKRETSGNFKHALLTILEYAVDPTKHYATMLRKAMKGLGTDDSTLIRILATRAEIDLQKIKEDYLKRYKRPLVEVVHSDKSGYYRAFLLSLLGSKF